MLVRVILQVVPVWKNFVAQACQSLLNIALTTGKRE